MSFKSLRRIASIFTLVIFTATNSIYAAPQTNSVFKNKKVDYKKISDKNEGIMQKKRDILSGKDVKESESQKKEAQKILSSHLSDLSLIHVPSEFGRVIEVYQNPDQDNSKVVVHIQDLHTNPEAEFNLSNILETLLKDYKLGLVCSEGADGEVDTSSVSRFPDAEVREKVARLFVNSGELTGEEYLSITKYPDLPIWGIENKDVYFQNIAEFNRIMEFNPSSQIFISQAKKALEELKPKIYSKSILAIDRKQADYENNKIETSDYLKYISSYIQKLNIPTTNYKNIALLNETVDHESKIDQQKIMQQSQSLLLNLQSAITAGYNRADMDNLMAKVSLFKDQKISPFSFYSYLKDLAGKYSKDQLSKYPDLMDFVDYLTKVNSLDSTKLFVEMEDLSCEIKQKLARNDEEKSLTQALRNIKFLEGFFNLKISNEELDFYLQNRDSHKVKFFEDFLKPALKKYDIAGFVDFNPDLIDAHLQELENFYKIAKTRDVIMFNNSIAEIEKRNVKVSALITGGFHTRGITQLLRDKGYSYVVVSPYSKTEIDEENYHFLLSGKRKPIEELMKEFDTAPASADKASKVSHNLRIPLITQSDPRRIGKAADDFLGTSEKLFSNTSMTIKGVKFTIRGLAADKIQIREIDSGVILKNAVTDKFLRLEVNEYKGKKYAKVGTGVYLINGNEADIFDLNPIGNASWFDFFGKTPSDIEAKRYYVDLPFTTKEVVLFPANRVLQPSLLPDRAENNAIRQTLQAYKDGDVADSIQNILHLAVIVGLNGTSEDYYLAQDILNKIIKLERYQNDKNLIVSVSDYLYLAYRGVDWDRMDRRINKLKTVDKDKKTVERTQTIYERSVESTRLAAPDLENWKVIHVEALSEDNLEYISEDSNSESVKEGNKAISEGKVVSVPFMGGSATTVKKKIGKQKMVHEALKVRVQRGDKIDTEWINIAQARIGFILGQNKDSQVVVVTSVDGTEEGDSDRSIRDYLDKEYRTEIAKGQMGASIQRAGLVLNPTTGEPLKFSDGHIATCAENHLWAFLSMLMDKNLITHLLQNSDGIVFVGNGDNPLNYPRKGMAGEILKARKEGKSVATIAVCSPSRGDKKGGFAAKVTYRNSVTGQEISQVEMREVSEFPTRTKETGFKAVDLSKERGDDLYKRLDEEKLFIEDIFGDKNVAFNVAFYAIDLKLFIARIFGFDENDPELIKNLVNIDKQSWTDRIIDLAERVPETVQPNKEVPNENNTDRVNGYITEQAVQDFIVNAMGLLPKNGVTPEVKILLGARQDIFWPYKGTDQDVVREDGSVVMDESGKPKTDYDLIANMNLGIGAVKRLAANGHYISLGENDRVIEILPVTLQEVIDANKMLASNEKFVEGRVELKKGQYDTKWWEEATMAELAKNPAPWGYDPIVPVEEKKGVLAVTLTAKMFENWSPDNPDGRDLDSSSNKYDEIGPLAIAGIRHVMNISNVHDTRQVKNSVERLLTSMALGLMVKIKYNKGANFPYLTNYGHEVRYHSEVFQDITTRTLAAMGFVANVVPGGVPTAIWNTSTMGKFFCIPLSFCGTSSHSPSAMDGLKIMDYEGSQFLISDIEALIAIKKAIVKHIKEKGSFTFTLAAESDPRITDQLYTSTNNGMVVYKEYQERAAADKFILDLIRSLDPSKVHIDCSHGSGYRTLTAFFKEMGLQDVTDKIDWMHKEERPDFGNMGKLQEDPKSGKDKIYDLGADGTQMFEKVMPDGKAVKYFPVLCTADYPEVLSKMPIGDIILPTDMDNDRLYYMQILPNDAKTKALMDETGVVYNVLSKEKIVAVFIPNKSFHFLHEMNFERITSLMREGKIDKNRTIVVLKTLASTPAVDKWAKERQNEGYKIEVINTAVGFAKLANVMYRAEGQMRENPGKDVIITDATGKDINIGSDPIVLAAWEESGGIITGITYGFKDLLGNSFLAEREKSATESIFLSLALISKLQKEKGGNVNFAEYLKEIYDRDHIDTPIDFRYDNSLYVPSASKESALEEQAGNERKNRIFGAYLSIAIAKMQGKVNMDEARVILKDIFNQEYEARKVQGQIAPALIERYNKINFDFLKDVWFTGDGVMFVFENEGKQWFVLFRPSGTEPKLKSYGFGKEIERLTTDAWSFAFNENTAGKLPESFTNNTVLMNLWGEDGLKAVDKGRRMQSAWEDFGLVIDPQDLNAGQLKDLEKRKLVRNFSPPDNHLGMVNEWLRARGLPEVKVDLDSPQAMPQEVITELLESVPEEVYNTLGRTKEEVLSKESAKLASNEKMMGEEDLQPILARLKNEKAIDQLDNIVYGKTFEEVTALNPKWAEAGFDKGDKKDPSRFGWTLENLRWILRNPDKIQQVLDDSAEIRAKYKYVIFCGMGGSGLSVQTVKTTFGEKEIKIYSLRTTDPAAIKHILENEIAKDAGSLQAALPETLIIPISKSGKTEETVSHKRYFEKLYGDAGINIKDHMWVITDKGSPMDTGDYTQREIQLNGKGDIGGRFTSPTTNIFLLPLALVAPEKVMAILEQARAMNEIGDIDKDAFIKMGAYLYHMAADLGKDKVTFMVPEELRDLPMWSEQLFEESLGKDGKGVTIFYGEDITEASLRSVETNDRVFLRVNVGGKKTNNALWARLEEKGYPVYEINVDSIDSIGGTMLGLQRAVASIGYLWDICFVNQPSVEGYKKATIEVMSKLQPGEKVQVPGDWKNVSFGKLKLYYDRLIKVGAVTESELELEINKLGADMDNAPAVYAAIINILKAKPGFEAKELTSYGRMTENMRGILQNARTGIFTNGLKMPSKLGEGPDKNHSYEENIEGGKNMWLSTYFMPLEVEQPEALQYDDNLIKAQTLGTVNSIVNRGRKVMLVTFDSTSEAAEEDLGLFFEKVESFLNAASKSKFNSAMDTQTGLDAEETMAIAGQVTIPSGALSSNNMAGLKTAEIVLAAQAQKNSTLFRKQQVDSMDQIVAVAAESVISDKKGFEKWIAQLPRNNAVVIIAASEGEFNGVKEYGNIAYIKVMASDVLREMFTVYGGKAEFFGGFKLGAPYNLDEYKTVVTEIASGV